MSCLNAPGGGGEMKSRPGGAYNQVFNFGPPDPRKRCSKFLSPAAPKVRDRRYCNAPICLSVTFSFRTVTRKLIDVIFSKLCKYVHQVMGVCCIVFDIDGMLFEFFMNVLNIEKNKILRSLFLNISCVLRVLCYFQHFKKIIWCSKCVFSGGGRGGNNFVLF